MAKVVRFHRLGGAEVLQIEDAAVAEPEPGEVRIRVHALGLNRAEVLFRSGLYIEDPELPSGLGLEAAGVVEMVGPNVTERKLGDRVALIPPVSMKQRPVHSELINYPADLTVPMPDSQSFESAAATWMAYLTAYDALIRVAALKAGDHVVITAASSSVGIAAIQLVNSVGAIPIAVTTSDCKREALLAAGAAHVLISGDSVVEAIGKVAPAGARVFFDAVGGKLIPLLASAAPTGAVIVNYGVLDASTTELPPAVLLAKSLTLRGYLVHEILRDPLILSRAKKLILEGLVSGQLCPTIARTFPLDEIVTAYEFLESNGQFGKVVVTI